MLYIIGLFLTITLILGGFTGTLPFDIGLNSINADISDNLNAMKQKTLDFIFPKSENKILLDNLNSNYDLLDRFFSSPETMETILGSDGISEEEKDHLRKAEQAFNETKKQVKELGSKAVQNEPGIMESLIKKTLGLDETEPSGPDPTHVPLGCNLVCRE